MSISNWYFIRNWFGVKSIWIVSITFHFIWLTVRTWFEILALINVFIECFTFMKIPNCGNLLLAICWILILLHFTFLIYTIWRYYFIYLYDSYSSFICKPTFRPAYCLISSARVKLLNSSLFALIHLFYHLISKITFFFISANIFHSKSVVLNPLKNCINKMKLAKLNQIKSPEIFDFIWNE